MNDKIPTNYPLMIALIVDLVITIYFILNQ